MVAGSGTAVLASTPLPASGRSDSPPAGTAAAHRPSPEALPAGPNAGLAANAIAAISARQTAEIGNRILVTAHLQLIGARRRFNPVGPEFAAPTGHQPTGRYEKRGDASRCGYQDSSPGSPTWRPATAYPRTRVLRAQADRSDVQTATPPHVGPATHRVKKKGDHDLRYAIGVLLGRNPPVCEWLRRVSLCPSTPSMIHDASKVKRDKSVFATNLTHFNADRPGQSSTRRHSLCFIFPPPPATSRPRAEPPRNEENPHPRKTPLLARPVCCLQCSALRRPTASAVTKAG